MEEVARPRQHAHLGGRDPRKRLARRRPREYRRRRYHIILIPLDDEPRTRRLRRARRVEVGPLEPRDPGRHQHQALGGRERRDAQRHRAAEGEAREPQRRLRPAPPAPGDDRERIVALAAPLVVAAAARAKLSAFFVWCLRQGLTEHNPVIGTEQPKRTASRDRVLSDDELFALWRAATRAGYPYGALVKMVMLTGGRLSEVARARWGEFDLPRALWTIPPARFKMNAVHLVPISPQLIALLNGLPRWPRGDFLFSTTGKRPFNGFGSAQAQLVRDVARTWRALGRLRGVVTRGEMEHWTLHDIRRTVRTRLSELRVPERVAELVIGHAKKGLARVYDQHHYLPEMREALDAWGSKLMTIVASVSKDNVVVLHERR